MSHYSYVLSAEVYRWMVADQIIPNKGEMNQKQQVCIPNQFNAELQNGVIIAKLIRVIVAKRGSLPLTHLEGIKNENTKAVRTTNWNFIWLCFDDLQLQFDPRIKDLILQGECALIPEIIKQLYDRDDNKDEKRMKSLLVNQKTLVKSETKVKSLAKQNTLDIKRINTQKNPNQSQSSLEFLILLLSSSFSMSVEEILGLFTNQNKYLAHLIVKGVNDNFEGVILFYSLLQKHIKKLKQFCENDIKDAESCLYAIKPGFISKNQRVAQLAIEVFKQIKNTYPWFISDTGRGSTTLILGIKRHPQLTPSYWNLLLNIISNQQMQFFTTHFKKCFRDAEQMIQICTYMVPSVCTSFLKDPFLQVGVIQQWMEIGINLFDGGNLQQKLISFRFIGAIMGNLPEMIEQNEEYLLNLKKGWRQRKMLEFIHLFDELLHILQQLAGEKNTMARKVYQIIIQIMEMVYDNDDKREYLVRTFITVLPKFPKIPTQYLIEAYKEGTLKTSDLELIHFAITLSTDPTCLIKIGESLLKLFNSHAVLNNFLGNVLYKLCVRVFEEESGKIFAMKIIKECLSRYSQLQGLRKIPEIAKHQPMYFVQKGNEKYSKQEQQEYMITDKCGKNIFKLIEKITELVMGSNNEVLEKALKQELMQTNAIIKKNHYKASNKVISNYLAKKFGVTRQEEEQFNQDFRVRKSLVDLQESMAKRKMVSSASVMPLGASRYAGPHHLKKQFDDVVQKRKKEQQEKKMSQQKRQREQATKKLLVKKQLQKTNLLRGFAQQAELKQDGFWQKFKENKGQLQLYPPELMEARDIEYIDNLFKKYHKILRTLFFKYTCSMYTIKSNYNFEDNKQRFETLTVVQLIQFLKDFKFLFLTNKDEIANLVRDLNVKLLKKRETQELDFAGFEQFIIQFCALIYTKTHTINANTNKGMEIIKKSFGHLSHLQLVEEWFNYLKLVFIQKGEKTSLFDEPQAAYFNETQVIKEFTKKIQEDPSFILPQGYKKVTEKSLKLVAKLSDKNQKINSSYKAVYEVLDEILSESELRIHLLQPLVEKEARVRVKPHAFLNIKAKILQAGQTKVRALSSIIDKKPAIPPVKLLQKKTLTFGMKLGLSYISYKDKLLGQQVAYVIDDMLSAVQSGKQTIEKQKIVNQFIKKRQEQYEKNKFNQIEKQKKRLERKNELQKMKKEINDRKQKELQQTKQQRQRKKQKQLSRQKKIREDKQKYLEQQKNKLKEKKEEQQKQELKKKQEEKKKKEEKKKQQEQFKNFNQKQIEKFKKQFDEQAQKRKKEMQKEEQQRKKKDDLVRKLRSKVHETDKKAIEAKQKINEQINQLYTSGNIKSVFRQFESSIRALFDFLLKTSYLSITEKKNNSEVVFDSWHYFNLVFQINPLIANAKELTKIFRHFTKDKQVHKDYEIGLTFDEFQQALLRVVIKHKSIFNKLSEKIKDDMTNGEIDNIVQKDIEQKQKNEFEQPKQINVRSLIKEEDIKKQITDHYGDISKVNQKTLKGLIYYLKIPKDKQGQEKRFRQILSSKISYSVSKIEQLREKLNDEYSLPVPKPKKRKTETNESMLKNSSQNV